MGKSRKVFDIVTLRRSSGLLAGNFKSSFHGSGIEFEEIRKYEIGDDVKSIDWLNSAKHNRVFVKRYREDREMPVLFAFQSGLSMLFGSAERRKIDTSYEAYNLLGLSLLSYQEPFGAIFYGSGYEEIEKKKGSVNFMRIVKRFEQLDRGMVKTGSDLSHLLRRIYDQKTRHHILFIFSDESSIGDEKIFKSVCKANDIVYVFISDTFEDTLSGSGIATVSDGKHSVSIDLDNVERKNSYVERRRHQISEIKKAVISAGGSFLHLTQDSNVYNEFHRFFKLRQKLS